MLQSLEPMISAHIKKLHIYKNHEHFRQIARGAIWQAWLKYDARIGDFQPFASQVIRGALLDELKAITRYDTHVQPFETTILQSLKEQEITYEQKQLLHTLRQYTTAFEEEILRAFYYEGYSHAEIAERFNITPTTLQKRKSRLLQRLRKQLQQEDFE